MTDKSLKAHTSGRRQCSVSKTCTGGPRIVRYCALAEKDLQLDVVLVECHAERGRRLKLQFEVSGQTTGQDDHHHIDVISRKHARPTTYTKCP
nr:hypothetical protein CFP56_20332 [Quercus suber]